MKSLLAVGAALWTRLALKLDLFQHPKLTRTAYRLPGRGWHGFDLWEELQRKITVPEFSIQVELQHARKQVWLRLEGVLSRADAEGLSQRIRDSLARTKARLVLDLKKLQWDKVEDLRPLREKLARYRSQIQLVLPESSASHPELILLAGMFETYIGKG
jgi:hypothetical protein